VLNKEGSHDLTKVARFESYRGFLFGSLNPDVPPLVEHLGEAAKIIDLIVDQSRRVSKSCAALRPTSTTATGSCRPKTVPTDTFVTSVLSTAIGRMRTAS